MTAGGIDLKGVVTRYKCKKSDFKCGIMRIGVVEEKPHFFFDIYLMLHYQVYNYPNQTSPSERT